MSNPWIAITYLLYAVTLMLITLGGSGYAVFVLGYSGWWILAGVLICGCAYSPAKWHGLWTGKAAE
jgi:hypothetical protein